VKQSIVIGMITLHGSLSMLGMRMVNQSLHGSKPLSAAVVIPGTIIETCLNGLNTGSKMTEKDYEEYAEFIFRDTIREVTKAAVIYAVVLGLYWFFV